MIHDKLPLSWRWARLAEVGTFFGGGTPRKSNPDFWGGNIPFVTGADVINQYVSKGRTSLTELGINSGQTYLCKPGTILLVTRTRVGRVGIAGCLLAASQDISPFVCGDELIPEYTYWYLRSLSEQLNRSTQGLTIQGLTRTFVENIPIILPPKIVQKEIAEHLESQMAEAQNLRKAAERQVEAIRSLISSLHRGIFSSVEASNWSFQPLSELIISGPSNGIFKSPEFFGSGIRLVNVSDLYLGLEVNQVRLGRVVADVNEQKRYSVSEGDVFFCRSSLKFEGVGKCCYIGTIQEPTIFECHVIRVRPNKEKIRSNYLTFYCQAGDARKYILRAAKLGTMTTINHDDIRNLPIPVPSPEIQDEIMNRITAKINLITQLQVTAEEQCLATEALPSVILREMFGGFMPPVED